MDEEEQFEDFTSASEWESFTSRLEQILIEFSSQNYEDDETKNWVVVPENILFADHRFSLTYYRRLRNEVLEKRSKSLAHLPPYFGEGYSEQEQFPFAASPHPVVDYFGLDEFVVLSSSGPIPIQNESKLKVLLSSALIALNNTCCNFPFFVQYWNWSQNYFSGIAEGSGIRTSFDMVQLRQVPSSNAYLNKLIDMFKQKITGSLSSPVFISANFFYEATSWRKELYHAKKIPYSGFDAIVEKISDPNCDNLCLSFLPVGTVEDAVGSITYVARWPKFSEDAVVDNPNYSDFDPQNPKESYVTFCISREARCSLKDLVQKAWQMTKDSSTLDDTTSLAMKEDINYASALEKIKDRPLYISPSLDKVINTAQRQLYDRKGKAELNQPIPEHLRTAVNFIFPDAVPGSFKYPIDFETSREEGSSYVFKSAPIGSLCWRLSSLLDMTPFFPQLWNEFVLELRYRWENSMLICGLESGAPNSATCLLNQKLQLLNCCITKRKSRDDEEKFSDSKENAFDEEEEDEFFDCVENLSEAGKTSPSSVKPVGRLKKFEHLKLLGKEEPLYIPVTQDPTPLTEDMIDEQAKRLVELGCDDSGSELRAKMLSASLQSDMEAFKAANPGAKLEDFVRWYSPRDWIVKDGDAEENGELSPRMKLPGNLWLEVWESARSVPVRRQKRLFDDTKEAEKVLHWLSSLRIGEIWQLLFPCLLHASFLKLEEESKRILPKETPLLKKALQLSLQLLRSLGSPTRFVSMELESLFGQVVAVFEGIERTCSFVDSVIFKFPSLASEITEDVQKLANDCRNCPLGITKSTLRLENDESRKQVQDLFQCVEEELKSKEFLKPKERMFTLKYVPVPSAHDYSTYYSRVPQRMFCSLKEDEFLLAGMFSRRTDVG